MMRSRLPRAAVATSQETLPEFIQLEHALINKLEALQRNLNNELSAISQHDRIEISPSAQNEIRRILLDAQRALGNIARTYAHSNAVLNFYRNVNQFVRMVDEMEMMFCQTLERCMLRNEVSEEEALLLDADESGSESEKTVEELFSVFSADNKNTLLADHLDMIAQIERAGDLSGAIYTASQLVDRNAQNPIFLVRFFDARRIVSEAIEKIHYVIHPVDSVAAGPRRRDRETVVPVEEACCYEFGLLSLCSEIKKQMRALLKENNNAQAKRIRILEMICVLTNKMPESVSSSDASSSSTSSESSDCDRSSDTSSDDSSRASSLASNNLFSRSRSPEPRNPSQSSNSGARLG